MKRCFIILLELMVIYIITQSNLLAQDGVIRGFISDRQTGQGVGLAAVSVREIPEGEYRGVVTDNNGHYQINKLKQGDYLFTVRHLGFEIFEDTLSISQPNEVILKNVKLVISSENLGEVEVIDQPEADNAGQIKIDPEKISRFPTPAGTGDLVSFIQNQPGVIVAGDRGGQLFVRGGTPSGNMVLMDGTLIYQPYHIVGFFSVFPEDVVSSADFYAGGFGAKFSGRSSSVMDVRLKNGNLYESGWSASISPFISDVLFESPVRKGKSSILVSMRGSLIERTSTEYLQEQQPLKFNSQLVKYKTVSEYGLGCSSLMMRTYDRGELDYETDQYFKWSNFVAGGRCVGASDESSLSFMEMNFGISSFKNEAGGVDIGTRKSSVLKSNLDMNFAHYIGETRINYGLFANFRTVNYDLTNRFISMKEREISYLTTGAFLEFDIPVGQYLSFEPGIVGTTYFSRVHPTLEPRLRFSADFSSITGTTLHGAVGVYSQGLIGLSDFRDLGNAFTAWVLPPDDGNIIETYHYLLGVRQSIMSVVDLTVEAYHKKIWDTPVSKWNPRAEFTNDMTYADGTVSGIDARLDLTRQNFYFGLGYGYSITEYETAQDHFLLWYGEMVQRYNPTHDRRHQVNAQMGFDVKKFSFNLNWAYGTGLPNTRPIGFDSYFYFGDEIPEVTKDYGDPRILLDKPFQGRLPQFHRLDVSMERLIELGRADLKLQVGAINTYDQKNLFYYDIYYQRGIDQLPLVPYVALKISSK